MDRIEEALFCYTPRTRWEKEELAALPVTQAALRYAERRARLVRHQYGGPELPVLLPVLSHRWA